MEVELLLSSGVDSNRTILFEEEDFEAVKDEGNEFVIDVATSHIQDQMLRDDFTEIQYDARMTPAGLFRVRFYSRF